MTGILKSFVAALVLTVAPVSAQEDKSEELDALFSGLAGAEGGRAAQIESRIYELWSQSGSPSMDLLLERGQKALADGDARGSIQHFSAVIDHAPGFAEAYNGRATAWFQLGRYGQSLEDIAATLALEPRHFGAMTGLALILEEIGNPEGALAAWRRVEELYPAREGMDQALRRLSRQVEGENL